MSLKIIQSVSDLIYADNPSEDDNDRIVKRYKEASPETKTIIDDIFISLTGYKLETIIAMCEEED